MEALETLGVNFKIIFIQIVGFLILYWVLNKFLFTRIRDFLRKRKEEIETAYRNNEEERQNLNRLKEEYDQKLKGIKSEAEKIIAEGRAKAEKIRQEILIRAEEDSRKFLQNSKKQLEEEKKRVVSAARNQIADLSLLVSSKLIRKSLNREDHLQIVEEYLPKLADFYEKN